jgi:hypothetical protein
LMSKKSQDIKKVSSNESFLFSHTEVDRARPLFLKSKDFL